MIKAVFFDLYHTLAKYAPSREELIAKTLKEFGIEAKPEIFEHPLVAADEFLYREMARVPLSRRSPEDKMALYARHQAMVLKEAGIKTDERVFKGVFGKMMQMKMDLVLFEDVPPVLDSLKKRGLILGLISNVEHDINPALKELGLPNWLSVIVTSRETGFAKPQPEIFREGLKRGGVQAEETIFVGDQYEVDCLGAQNAGLQPVLLDRQNHYKNKTGCPRIKSLNELEGKPGQKLIQG
jgi:putative hydrolase of the HAD superfamily